MRFHYLKNGAIPTVPPMLLLPTAWKCDRPATRPWDFGVALGFSDDYRVIVLDQRGHGDSDWAP